MRNRKVLTHHLFVRRGISHGFAEALSFEPHDCWLPRQVHGAVAMTLNQRPVPPSNTVEADAVVSLSNNYAVGVVTADCVPILASSEDGATAVAIHAGWRGLARGIVASGLSELNRVSGTKSWLAVIGPHIGPCCYEVDAPVLDQLGKIFGNVLDDAVSPSRPGHVFLDLGKLVRSALLHAGGVPEKLGDFSQHCTMCSPEGFPSYRREGSQALRMVHWIRPFWTRP